MGPCSLMDKISPSEGGDARSIRAEGTGKIHRRCTMAIALRPSVSMVDGVSRVVDLLPQLFRRLKELRDTPDPDERAVCRLALDFEEIGMRDLARQLIEPIVERAVKEEKGYDFSSRPLVRWANAFLNLSSPADLARVRVNLRAAIAGMPDDMSAVEASSDLG